MAKKTAKKSKKKSTTKKSAKKSSKVENKNHLKGIRKLDEKIVDAIRKNAKKGMKITRILEIVKDKGYDVTYASVRNVITGFTWKHTL